MCQPVLTLLHWFYCVQRVINISMKLPRYLKPNMAQYITRVNLSALKCETCNYVTYYAGIVALIIALPFIVIGLIVWFASGHID